MRFLYELARRLQRTASRKSVLLVALTGYGSPEQRARALEAGFDLHRVKPVEPDQLAALISAGRDGALQGAVDQGLEQLVVTRT